MKLRTYIIGLLSAALLVSGFAFIQNQESPAAKTAETEKIQWHTFQEAVELSKKEKKKIFIDVYTSWCGWCKTLDKNTFSNAILAKYINQKYYAVKMDAEMKDTIVFNNYTFVNPNPQNPRSTHQIATSLLDNKMGYPSMVFLDDNFNKLFVLQTYLTPDKLEPYVKIIGDNAYLTTTWDEYLKTFKGEIVPPPAVGPPAIPAPH